MIVHPSHFLSELVRNVQGKDVLCTCSEEDSSHLAFSAASRTL